MNKKRYWNGSEYEDVEVAETNGDLILIEKEDGTCDWVCEFELDQ